MADFKGSRKSGGFSGGGKFGGGSRGNGSGNRGGSRGSFNDRQMFSAICCDCGKACEVPFRPSAGKQVRCSSCFELQGGSQNRDSRAQSGRSNSFEAGIDKKMFQAVCAECGNSCEVPFRPYEGKKVLCESCFHGAADKSIARPAVDFKDQLAMVNAKLDKILYLLNSTKKPESVEVKKLNPLQAVQEVKTEKPTGVKIKLLKNVTEPKKIAKPKKVELLKSVKTAKVKK